MKKNLLTLTFLLVAIVAYSQTWNGTNNTNWNDPANWSGGAVPTSTGDVVIPGAPTGNRFPVFATNVSIGSINMQAGSKLDVNGKTLTLAASNAYIYFTGATINNSGAGSITINANTGTGGYGMYIRSGCIFNGNTIINGTGANPINEGDVAGSNSFNGNVTWNINSGLSFGLSNTAQTTYGGDLSVNRTVAGAGTLFSMGAAITGNFLYSNLIGGPTNIGSLANQTIIGGTLNINNTYSIADAFNLVGIKNNLGGGAITVQGSQGFSIQNDTLLLSSLSVTGYSGNQFAYLFNNKITGNLTIGDASTYTSNYSTTIRANTITGNTIYNINGSNAFYEADNSSATNDYHGNVSLNITSSAAVNFSAGDTASITGSLAITRTGAGATNAFGYGGSIGGNFTFSNNSMGNLGIGNLSSATLVSGTVNITNADTSESNFAVYRLKNLTPGGNLIATHTRGFDLQNDSLLLNSLSITDYLAGQFGYFYNNKIDGNVTIADNPGYNGGYTTNIQNNNITGNTTYTISGPNTFRDADVANSTNVYNGNVVYNVPGTAAMNIAISDTVVVTGNVTINRTGAGTTSAFGYGGSIGGNFIFSNNSMGNLGIGNLNSTTLVNGTVNITNTDTSASSFAIYRLKNLTSGGAVNAAHTLGFDLQNDSLLLNSLSITDYQGSQFAYFYNNKINGNITIADNPGYTGGYTTNIQNNDITGNTTYTISGPNALRDADAVNSANIYKGNVVYNVPGNAIVYIASQDTVAVTGNVTINRTAPGATFAFKGGGTIGGNFSFTNNTSGSTTLGTIYRSTYIGGTLDVDIHNATTSYGNLFGLNNKVAGGHVALQNTLGFALQTDTLVVNNVSITGYTGNNFSYLYSTKITGNLVVVDDASYTGNYSTDIANNYVSGTAAFTVNGSNAVNDGQNNNSGNTYLGNTTYTRVGTGAMNVATGDTSCYGSGLTFNSSAALPINTNYIRFIGTANGNFGQAGTQPFTIPNVIMRKNPLAKVSLGNPLTISNQLVLDSGILVTTTADKLIIPAGINYTGGSNLSFVQGPMDKIGNTAFAFPVGMDTVIAPISISAPAALTDVFTASYIHKSPTADGYDSAQHAVTLDHISHAEYWILNRTAGTSNVSVTLSYDTLKRSGRVKDNMELRVSRWNGSSWTDAGNGGVTGTLQMGTVQSAAAITSFSPFTLASVTARNTLPVTLVYFKAANVNGIAVLQWQTENELNFSHFEIEKSADGNNFSKLTSVASKGGTVTNNYSVNDNAPFEGANYYRLRSVDNSGIISYSNVIKLDFGKRFNISIFPNPAHDHIKITNAGDYTRIQIMDATGKLVKQMNRSLNADYNIYGLAKGVYLIRFIGKDVSATKIIIE